MNEFPVYLNDDFLSLLLETTSEWLVFDIMVSNIPVMEFQAWEYKFTNNHEQIHKKILKWRKAVPIRFFTTL